MQLFKNNIYYYPDKIFDILYKSIKSKKSFNVISTALVVIFFIVLFSVFIKNIGILPEIISTKLPSSYFFAVEFVFRILLAIEIIEMVLILAYSVTDLMAKQFEIFSLILLRQAFKEFSDLDLPLHIEEDTLKILLHILSDLFGALIIFFGVYIFKKNQICNDITSSLEEKTKFISAKKSIALLMTLSFIILGIYNIVLFAQGKTDFEFFSIFYSILIFTDILIVIISLRYNHHYAVVFRNTAFALGTILIRFALSLPRIYDAILGIIALIFVISVTIIYNKLDINEYQ